MGENAEALGAKLGIQLINYIARNRGQYLRNHDGSLHVIIAGQRILINSWHDNLGMARLMRKACNVSTLYRPAAIAIQVLQIHADAKATDLQMRKFSAVSPDGGRLYLPLKGDSLLLIEADHHSFAKNGDNRDRFWVEHPKDNPFAWVEEERGTGFDHFERLLVDTQACQEPAMKWLVAMHEGLFPFVRDLCPGQFLLVHIGGSQSGKTTGAQRFDGLHGLGSVTGDYSIAALSNQGDTGLLAMDNKEQNNLSPEYIDFLLHLATGGERGRSYKDGRMRATEPGRPVGVVTSIDGIAVRPELRQRCVEIRYIGDGTLDRGPIEREIRERRNSMSMAIAEVLACFLGTECTNAPNPIPAFAEHFKVLYHLLGAYGMASGKPEEWADEISGTWATSLASQGESEGDILAYAIESLLRTWPLEDPDFTVESARYRDKGGRIFITECAPLLARFQAYSSPARNIVPQTPEGLGRRLRSMASSKFQVLDEERAPNIFSLRRTPKRRPIGFFQEYGQR